MKKLGFTLIELLIVIAIILILISIALPNFLEAQVRARITNAMGEMRAIEPAIAAYYQDWKRFPRDGFEIPSIAGYYPEENPRIWVQLTSPIKYFSTIPYDEFHSAYKDTNNLQRSDKHQTYRYYAAWWRCLALGGSPVQKSEKCTSLGGGKNYDSDFLGKWIIWSPGPNRVHDFGEWAMYKPLARAGWSVTSGSSPFYCATNGTISDGDIVKWGS
jgi:prepilin-type N-terminal cleavage/methylation domain-containing protein